MNEGISHQFDEGKVTVADVDQLLDEVYGDDEAAKADRRSRVVQDNNIVKFQLIGLAKQAKEASQNQRIQEARSPVQETFIDDVPEYDDEGKLGPDYVPEIKSKLGIISGVRMFGKEQSVIKSNRTEGVKVRCPFPHHDDRNPSAWVNTEKNTWFCGKCQVGGDVIDFYAAAQHGLAPQDFHRSPEFRTITEKMAERLGIEVYTPYDTSEWESPLPDEVETDTEDAPDPDPDEIPSEDEILELLTPESRETDPPVPQSAEAAEPITLTESDILRGVSYDPNDLSGHTPIEINTPHVDVDELAIPENTFLHTWLTEITKAYPWVPEEYLLMLGIQAIGLAAGHHAVSRSANLPLTGSLLVSIIGPSGYGKTTAANFLRDLIHTASPKVKFDPSTGTGIKEIMAPASPEALIANVKTEIDDPMNATGGKIEKPTTAWMFEDELATFISRSRRVGGGHMKQRLMQFHDFAKQSKEREAVFDESSVSGGRRVVHDSFLSATFLTQTEALRSLTESSDLVSGFLNRIIPVFGHQNEKQHPFQEYTLDPAAFYKTRYSNLYDVCRKGASITDPHVLAFDDGIRDFYDHHPFFANVRVLIDEHPIYARLQHITFRLALLLAINEHARDAAYNSTSLAGCKVERQHVALAVDIMERLIAPGFEAMMKAVLANEVNEYLTDFISFIRDHLDKYDKFPTKTKTAQARFNNKYPVHVRRQGQDYALRSGLVVEMNVASKTKGIPHYAIPEGKYAGLTNQTTYKAEELYHGTK